MAIDEIELAAESPHDRPDHLLEMMQERGRVHSALGTTVKSHLRRALQQLRVELEPSLSDRRNPRKRDSEAGQRSVLYRMLPGAELEPHGHGLPEECYVASGALVWLRTGIPAA